MGLLKNGDCCTENYGCHYLEKRQTTLVPPTAIMMKSIYSLCAIISILVSHSLAARNFYIKSSGNDGLNGRTIAQAWRTANNINLLNLDAGDSVFFEAGSTVTGNIYLSAEDSGSAKLPVYFGSYGTGRASIAASKGFGLYAYNVGGIHINNLTFIGLHPDSSTNTGISFYTDDPNGRKFDYIRLSNLEISGFRNGVQFGSYHRSYPGFSQIMATHLYIYNNLLDGFSTYDMALQQDTLYAHRNVYIGYCYLNNNGGSGLVLGGVQNGLVERVKASRTGQMHNKGVVGIWAWSSQKLVFRYCVADSTRTDGPDGGGFDLDGGTESCVIEHCYATQNDGPGFMHCDYPFSRPTRNNIIRSNISERDGLQPDRNKSALLYISWGSGLQNCLLHNNTTVIGNKPDGRITGLQAYIMDGYDSAVGIRNCRAYNNIVYATGDSNYLLHIFNGIQFNIDTGDLKFCGNVYYAERSSSRKWAVDLNVFTSITNWRNATGQEIYQQKPTGWINNPKLEKPGNCGAIAYPDLNKMKTRLAGYTLNKDAPHIDLGVAIPDIKGNHTGIYDFFGNPAVSGKAQDIGAHEAFSPEIALYTNGCNNLKAFVPNAVKGLYLHKQWSVHPVHPDSASVYNSFDDTLLLNGLMPIVYHVRCSIFPDTLIYAGPVVVRNADMNAGAGPRPDFQLNNLSLCLPYGTQTFFPVKVQQYKSVPFCRWETASDKVSGLDTLRKQFTDSAWIRLTLTDDSGCSLTKTFQLKTDSVHGVQLPAEMKQCSPDSTTLFVSHPDKAGKWRSTFTLLDIANDTVISMSDTLFRYYFTLPFYKLRSATLSGAGCKQENATIITVDTTKIVFTNSAAEICHQMKAFDLRTLQPKPSGGAWLHQYGNAPMLSLPQKPQPYWIPFTYVYTDSQHNCRLTRQDSIWVRDTLRSSLPSVDPICKEIKGISAGVLFQLTTGSDSIFWQSTPTGLAISKTGMISPAASTSNTYSIQKFVINQQGCPTLQSGILTIDEATIQLKSTISATQGLAPLSVMLEAINELLLPTTFTWIIKNERGVVLDTIQRNKGGYLFNDTGKFSILLAATSGSCNDTVEVAEIKVSGTETSGNLFHSGQLKARVYPNPANSRNTAYIELNNVVTPTDVHLYNVMGKKVTMYHITDGRPHEIATPQPGLYYLVFNAPDTPLIWFVE
jgi:hypothetical protein